jgi:hypothetical protein
MPMLKRWVILLTVLLVGVFVALYTSGSVSLCRVASDQVSSTFGRPFKTLTERDWIVGVNVTITNNAGCQIHVKSGDLTVLDVTYSNGTQTLNLENGQAFNEAIDPGNTTSIVIVIEPPFPLEPKALTVRFEATIAELDQPLLLEGTIQLPEA